MCSALVRRTRESQPCVAPVLQVAGAEQPVRLQALRLEVEVVGRVAQTKVTMEFFNPNRRLLEGRLQFPLTVASERPLTTAFIELKLLRNLPLDLRVVLDWDADDTDVDLHVIDPNGEEVYYDHRTSCQGGAITRDATGGYGPEEFAPKVAKPGRYRVEANFYGHREQMLTRAPA